MSDSAKTKIKEIKCCRVCGNEKLVPIISLGEQHISNFISSEMEEKEKVPLDLVLCELKSGGCGLLQLRHTTPGELMYEQYWYRSGLNESMRLALADITQSIRPLLLLKPDDRVLDIGCNDGTLLRSYGVDGLQLYGIDPAKNLVPYSSKGTTKIINDYFSAEAIGKNLPGTKFKAITSIAMFYDLDDPNKFVGDIAKVLEPEGLWIIQMSYLPLMLETNAFDNICHEHLEYYSLMSLESLLERHGLEVFDVSLNDVNGGSFRAYCGFNTNSRLKAIPAAQERVLAMRHAEMKLGLDERTIYEQFASRIDGLKEKTFGFIKSEVAKGKKIYVYGASTKGNTLLQTYGLDKTLITAAAERNSDKYGKMTIGTHIPIISEDEARVKKPDYFLILPWHFLSTFIAREDNYLKCGGKFIVPLPQFKILGAEAVK